MKYEEIVEVTDQDGDIWEIRNPANVPCECRLKGMKAWQECNWSIFCEKHGIDHDALAE